MLPFPVCLRGIRCDGLMSFTTIYVLFDFSLHTFTLSLQSAFSRRSTIVPGSWASECQYSILAYHAEPFPENRVASCFKE
ncbi:hypothetical protein A0H81_10236 [Grifola frondosa]|uniref:Uncharacterized protein n=1 Tax=Grifola frondosa TaxID=5627 RepID=A0A1C7M0Q7_GRIFR|nr:hypothetical protein A0H81_10236 [Grifola frondosa]